MAKFFERRAAFWGAAALLLAFMGTVMFYAAVTESVTFDEPTYIAAGYDYLTKQDYWFNPEHPPLAKFIAAIPLLPLDLRVPSEHPDYRRKHPQSGPRQFLYGNRVPPDEILIRARAPFIVLTLAFGLVLALWTRRVFGPLAAVIALFFYALDPAIISHGHYASTDFVIAVFFFLTCVVWVEFLQTKRWALLPLTGVLLGLAIASKFSALLLVAYLPLLLAIRFWQAPRQHRLWQTAASLLLVFCLAGGVVALIYYPVTKNVFKPGQTMMRDITDRSVLTGKFFGWLGDKFPIGAHPLPHGIIYQDLHNKHGHDAYLAGETSKTGWWYYFPVVFVLKTPLALQLGLVAALVTGFLAWKTGWLARLRSRHLAWIAIVLVPLLFMGLAMKSNINLGQRYLLPIYPFIYVFAGAALVQTSARKQWVLPALALVLVAEHALIAPHYLAYFNPLAGGPSKGPEYLVDSNIDWGQDLYRLHGYLEDQGSPPVCIQYFGTADTAYHGIRGRLIPSTSDTGGQERMDCLAAVSVSYLYPNYDYYSWLREMEPIEKIGYSIYVYDLRRPHQ